MLEQGRILKTRDRNGSFIFTSFRHSSETRSTKRFFFFKVLIWQLSPPDGNNNKSEKKIFFGGKNICSPGRYRIPWLPKSKPFTSRGRCENLHNRIFHPFRKTWMTDENNLQFSEQVRMSEEFSLIFRMFFLVE